MQQLTLQFDGYADEQQRVDVAAPARKAVRVTNQAAARVKSVAFGLSVRAQRTVSPWLADWKAWAARRNEAYTALCATEYGEVFTNGDVVKAHLSLAAIIILTVAGGAL